MLKGEDVVIGVIDGGVWPESPSYADRVDANGMPVRGGRFTRLCRAAGGLVGHMPVGRGLRSSTSLQQQADRRAFLQSRIPGFWTAEALDGVLFAARLGGRTDRPWRARVAYVVHRGRQQQCACEHLGGSISGGASGIAPRARIATYKVCYTYVNPAAADGTGSSELLLQLRQRLGHRPGGG